MSHCLSRNLLSGRRRTSSDLLTGFAFRGKLMRSGIHFSHVVLSLCASFETCGHESETSLLSNHWDIVLFCKADEPELLFHRICIINTKRTAPEFHPGLRAVCPAAAVRKERLRMRYLFSLRRLSISYPEPSSFLLRMLDETKGSGTGLVLEVRK